MKNVAIAPVVALAVIPATVLFAAVIASGQVQTNTNAPANATVRGSPFPRQLTLFDRAGNVVRMLGEPSNYDQPTLSPDGSRLAVVRADLTRPRVTSDADPGRRSVVRDLWVFDLSTGASTQIASGPELWDSVWSPDGSQIAYSSYREGCRGLYRKASDGTGAEQLLYQHHLGVVGLRVTDWSPDGKFLTFGVDGVLRVVPLTTEPMAVELLREEFEAGSAHLSPDSRFVAYHSNESGRDEVYVRAFDFSMVRFSLSQGGGGFGGCQGRRTGLP